MRLSKASQLDGAQTGPACLAPACCGCPQSSVPYGAAAAAWLLLGCFLATAAWALSSDAARRHRERHRHLQAVAENEWDEAALRRLFQDSLPSWLADPQTVRQPEWLNAVLRGAWPQLSMAAERFATRGGRLEELLNSSAVWRPRWMVTSRVAVQGMYLGQTPPRITAVRVVAQPGYVRQRQLALDCSFSWRSELEVKLLFYLFSRGQEEHSGRGCLLHYVRQLVPRAMFLKIGVRQVVVSGTLRLMLGPMQDQLPVLGAARLSLLGPPDFSYHTSVFGGNPFVMPGVEAWLNSFIRASMLAPYLFPEGYDLPLPGAPEAMAARQEPEGLLEVEVVEAANVPRMDFWGSKADPYVKLWVREDSQFSSSVRGRTLSPLWHEHFTVIVHTARYQSLTLVLLDSDALLPDEEVGRAQLPLSCLDTTPGAVADLWLPLVRPYSRRHKGRRQQPSKRQGGRSFQQGASFTAGGYSAAVVDREDTARSWIGMSRRGSEESLSSEQPQPSPLSSEQPQPSPLSSGQPQPSPQCQLPTQQPPHNLTRASTALNRLAGLVPGVSAPGPGQDCALHIRVSYAPFTPQEVEAAMSAGRPGIVSILRRLSRVSRVPELLRSGVLTIHLERAEGLNRKAQAGFTRNYKVKVSVGQVSKTTERGKVAYQHKRDPVFDERMELLIDGDTAASERSQVELEVWASHFVRRDSFKGRAVVPLREVQRHRRLRGSFPLHGGQGGGSLVLELAWKAAAGMY